MAINVSFNGALVVDFLLDLLVSSLLLVKPMLVRQDFKK
jgi:hypothetical protein